MLRFVLPSVQRAKHNRAFHLCVAALSLVGARQANALPSASAPPYVVELFRPPKIVYAITTDTSGYVWFGTREGLYRHDGVNLTAHPMRGGLGAPLYWVYWLHAMAATPSGDLWLGLGGGRLTFSHTQDAPAGAFKVGFDEVGGGGLLRIPGAQPQANWSVPNSDDGKPFHNVWSLAPGATSDELWIGTAQGLVRHRAGQLKRWTTKDGLPHNFVIRLLRTDDGAVYVGTAAGLARVVNDRIVGTPATAPVTAIANAEGSTSTSARVWVGGPGGLQLWTFDDGGGKLLSHHRKADGLPADEVRALARTRDALWVATSEGLARLAGGTIENWAGRLSDDSILSLGVDANNDVWAGTTDGGVAWIHRPWVHMLGAGNGDAEDQNTNAVVRARDGSMWISKTRSLQRFALGSDGRAIAPLELRGGVQLPPGGLGSLAADKASNGVWVAIANAGRTELVFVGETLDVGKTFSLADGTKAVRPIVDDGRGYIWVGDAKALAKYRVQRAEDGTPTHIVLGQSWTQKDGLCAGGILSIAVTKSGDVWAGSSIAGVTKLSSSAGVQSRCVGSKDSIVALPVTALVALENGTLWMGFANDGGLGRLTPDGRFVQLTQNQGLGCDNISAATTDKHGRMWMGCHGGVGRALLSDLDSVADGRVAAVASVSWSTEKGMRVDRCSSEFAPAMAVGDDGDTWVATPGGVAVIEPHPHRFPESGITSAPAPRIESITGADHEATSFSAVPVVFDGPSATLDLRWSAPVFAAPDGLAFEWRLQGNDGRFNTPRRVGGNPRLLLFDVRDGAYAFCVRTFVAGNAQGSDERCVPLQIATPWHRRMGLVLGSAIGLLLLAGAAAWLWHVFRLKRLAQRHAILEEERARIARELHDSLGQGMTTIGYHVGAAALALGSTDKPSTSQVRDAQEIIGRTRQLVAHCRDAMRSSLWDLRSSASARSVDAAIDLVVKSQQTAMGSSRAHVTVQRQGPPLPASALLAQELSAFIGEALTNANKHAQAKHIVVHLDRQEGLLHVCVEDDGVGFPFDEKNGMVTFAESGHFGLVGMAERARRLGTELQIKTKPHEGTKVKMDIALKAFERRS